MPAPKKAGSARRSKATTAVPAVPAADSTATDSTPRKKRGSRPKKTFLLYARSERELSYICESEGATGQIASINAVKNGTIAAGTPIVFITPATLDRQVEVEAENVGVRYKIKAGKKRQTRKIKPKAPPAASSASEAAAPAPSARTSRTAKAADAPTPPAPGATSGNPFAS